MAIYSYKCPVCGRTKEKIGKLTDLGPECDVHDDARGGSPVYMKLVVSVPSPAQWNCRRPS